MPDFDLDAALTTPDVPGVFVYSQEVVQNDRRLPYVMLMLGPDEQGRATAVAHLSWEQRIPMMRWIGPGNRWKFVYGAEWLKQQARSATVATAKRQHHMFFNLNSGDSMSVEAWWKVGMPDA